MFYVGLDIHSRRIAVCVLTEAGQLARRAQAQSLEEVVRILKALPDRFEVCYEASCGYGHYHDVLCPLAARVLVAHPGQLRLIFRSKYRTTATTPSGWPSSSTSARRRRSACPRRRSGPGGS